MQQHSSMNWTSCVRVGAIHICTPDTPAYRFRRSLVAIRTGFEGLARLKFHVGRPVEIQYKLKGFGIPIKTVPMTSSGTIKVVYHKQWMKLRKVIEAADDNDIVPLNSAMIVECPKSNDVLFRQGTPIYAHPGNVQFRSLVEQKASDCPQDQDPWNRFPTTTATLIANIIDEILNKRKGRVLVWDGCWRTLTNEEEIYAKIEYIVREYLRGMGRTENQIQNNQNIESSTSIFRSSKNSLSCDTSRSLFVGTGTSTSSLTLPTKNAATVPDDDRDNQNSNKRLKSTPPSSDDENFVYLSISNCM